MLKRIQTRSILDDTTLSSSKTAAKWHPAIEEPLRSQTLEAVQLVAERLHNPDAVTAVSHLAAQQSTGFWGWSPASLSSGFGSTALLFLFLAQSFPDKGWGQVARQHLRLAADSTHQQPFLAPGMFGGSSGLASVISFLALDDNRYQQATHSLNERVAEQVLQRQWQRKPGTGVADADYDAIMGAAGTLSFLVTIDQPDEKVRAAIHKLLDYLLWLAGSDEEHERKRWFLPPELYPIELHRKSYPDGYFNCGLAHGIPGPLAAIAIAWRAGYRVPGQAEAMGSLARWIVEHQLHDTWGINWPGGVPLEKSSSSTEWSSLSSCRTAWCYGNPGISRALLLAGTALDDTQLCEIAVQAIESVLRRPITARGIDSVTFCHGVAGLLAICLRFAHETNSELVRQHIPLLVSQILSGFDPCHPLGFRDLERDGTWVDDPGLLTGAAGVALTLLAAASATEPAWDRIFLIS